MPSMDQIVAPENCSNLAEVREGVDAIDRALVALIARRFAFMDAAARIKQDRGAVRDEARKAQVLANVEDAARDVGVPPELATKFWEQLVEASIAHEFETWDRLRAR